jgi:CrcB protein
MRIKRSIRPALEEMASDAIVEAELERAARDRPVALPRRRARVTDLVSVSAGGLLGAPARYYVGQVVARHWGSAFPWGTLLINLTGCFVLGLFLTLATERFAIPSWIRLFFTTGFLGAYTTFSTFSYETVRLMQHGRAPIALAYIAVSLAGGLAAVLLGIELGSSAHARAESVDARRV